jgi:hypothetical protein
MSFIQCGHGFIFLSKVKKMHYQNTKHIGILYDLIQGCQWKELLECWKVNLELYLK